MRELPCFTDESSKSLIKGLCEGNDVDLTLIVDLCEVMLEYSGSGRREGIVEQFNQVIDRFLIRTDS